MCTHYNSDKSTENPNFVYAVLRSHKRFETLRNFTLESGQEEIDRQTRARKDRGESGGERTTKTPSGEDSQTKAQGTVAGAETPTSSSRFEIGDGDDSDEEVNPNNQQSLHHQNVASPAVPSRNPSISSSIEDAVPLQLRGMSEKARGKLPEGAFQRQGSTTSLASHSTNSPRAPNAGFTPTPAWVCLICRSLFTRVLTTR